MVTRLEQMMGRRQIAEIIRRDPVDIVFERREKIKTPGGGWKYGPTQTLDPQTVTLVPMKRRMSEFLVGTELGEIVNGVYVIVGAPDLDVERGDLFEVNEEEFEVKQVDIKRDVRTAAIVDYYGQGDD